MAVNGRDAGGAPEGSERDPRLDRLYREAAREAPPPHLDAAILAAARREVGARPQALSSRLRGWRIPVSIAAVVVLSVSLVTLLRQEAEDQFMQALPGAAPASRPDEAAVQPEREPARADAGKAMTKLPGAAPAPAAAPARDSAGVPPVTGILADSPRREVESAAAQGAGAPPEPEPVAKTQAQPFQGVPGIAERRAVAPPAAPVEDLTTRAPVAAERAAAPAATRAPEAPARSKALARARPDQEAAAPDARRPVWHGLENEPAQKWLERIGQLKREGRTADAEAVLAEFKRRFPDHPLPPDTK